MEGGDPGEYVAFVAFNFSPVLCSTADTASCLAPIATGYTLLIACISVE